QAWYARFHHRLLLTRWFLVPMALAGLASVLAMESGWMVTEIGRQPWVVYGYLRTTDAVTTANGVPVTLVLTVLIYLVLTGVIIIVPWIMSRRWRAEQVDAPADPAEQPSVHRVRAGSKETVG